LADLRLPLEASHEEATKGMTTEATATSAFYVELMSKTGGREVNEDCCGFADVGDSTCCVVADGLGGHGGGKAASAIAVEAILSSFRRCPEVSLAALQSHMEAAQSEILRWQREDRTLAMMRTTVVVLLAGPRGAVWGHIGDSRLYRFDAGRIVSCTQDDSVLQALVNAGDLSPDAVRYHPDRNRLLHSLGDNDGELRPNVTLDPCPLYRGTTFLLCTDGWWEHVLEGEMEADYAKAGTPRGWLAAMEGRLLARAPAGHDNYTALAACCAAPEAPLPPAYATGKQEPAARRGRGAVVTFWVAVVTFSLLLAVISAFLWLGPGALTQVETWLKSVWGRI
jgi:serine/threonine protein phosphatase PrpC